MLSEMLWTIDKLAVALGCAIPLTWIIGYFWYKALVTRSELDLKRRLAERCMSVEDIERVVRVRPGNQGPLGGRSSSAERY